MATLCACSSAQDAKPDTSTITAAQDTQISEYVRRVFQDREGNLWFGTNSDGVCRYDGESLDYFSLEQGFSGVAVRGIVQDSAGAVWFATDGGVSRFQDGVFTNYTVADGLSHNETWSIMLDKSGIIWVGTVIGVCRFDGTSFVPFSVLGTEGENSQSVSGHTLVSGMFEDQAGNIWFGTDGEGVRKFDGEKFTIYTSKDGLAGDQVYSVTGDRLGRIWFGFRTGGVSFYDGSKFQTLPLKDELNSRIVWTMLEDRVGNLWISTLGAGVTRYDGNSFRTFGEPEGLTRSHVQSIMEDKDGTLWFGCSGGLFRFDGSRFINVTRTGPWISAPQSSESITTPMGSFARLLGGAWKMTAQSGTSMYDRWQWGPGQHSLSMTTEGEAADGSPWRALQVVYWNPGQKQIRLLSMHPDVPGVGRGVGDGTITFVGDTLEATVDLYQARGPRKLRWLSIFEGPDNFHTTLLEANGSEVYRPLTAWNYARVDESFVNTTAIPEQALGLSKELSVLESIIGHTWDADGKRESGQELHIQSTFEYVPLAEYVYGRTVGVADNGTSTHLLDLYFYHDVGTDALRCLALSEDGGVHEGDVTAPEAGALQIDVRGYENGDAIARVIRFDYKDDSTLRQRVWSLDGNGRTLVLDLLHNKIKS